MAEATAKLNPIHERASRGDPARHPALPVGESGAVLGCLGASVHSHLAEDDFLFLRKDCWGVLGGLVHSKSCRPRRGLAQGSLWVQGSYQGRVGSH